MPPADADGIACFRRNHFCAFPPQVRGDVRHRARHRDLIGRQPGISDLDGLTRGVQHVIDYINQLAMPDDERQKWIAQIEVAFDAAAGRAATATQPQAS